MPTPSSPIIFRKMSAYNVFVREMMKTNDIKNLHSKLRMGAINKLWKKLDEGGRTTYTKMANKENAWIDYHVCI